MNVTDVAAIADPMVRMTKAAALVQKAEAKIEEHRQKRALAVLVLLRPWADAVAPSNAARAQLRAQRDAGTIGDAEYRAALEENRQRRQQAVADADVKIKPVDVYEMLGVARNLVNRILMRMPDEPLPPVAHPEADAKRAHRAIPQWEATLEQAREIRDTAALLLLSGLGADGERIKPLTNAEVARATGLTTARIAQLREAGVR